MKCKWHVPFVLAVALLMLFASSVSAAPSASSENTVQVGQIPDTIKSTNDLIEYLHAKGIVKTMDDLKSYMINNKQVVKGINPKIIDYGYTYRLYAEINKPFRDDGLTKITHNYGTKEVKVWVVPVAIMNYNDQPQDINKDNFALVPKDIPQGKELYTLAIEPEYIMDGTTGKMLGEFKLPPKHEVHLNAVFYLFPTTSEQNVNLRILDGKDHTDVSIANP